MLKSEVHYPSLHITSISHSTNQNSVLSHITNKRKSIVSSSQSGKLVAKVEHSTQNMTYGSSACFHENTMKNSSQFQVVKNLSYSWIQSIFAETMEISEMNK